MLNAHIRIKNDKTYLVLNRPEQFSMCKTKGPLQREPRFGVTGDLLFPWLHCIIAPLPNLQNFPKELENYRHSKLYWFAILFLSASIGAISAYICRFILFVCDCAVDFEFPCPCRLSICFRYFS